MSISVSNADTTTITPEPVRELPAALSEESADVKLFVHDVQGLRASLVVWLVPAPPAETCQVLFDAGARAD